MLRPESWTRGMQTGAPDAGSVRSVLRTLVRPCDAGRIGVWDRSGRTELVSRRGLALAGRARSCAGGLVGCDGGQGVLPSGYESLLEPFGPLRWRGATGSPVNPIATF